MKRFSAYIILCLILTGWYACNNNNSNSKTQIATSLNDAQFVSIKSTDSFLLKIKGNQSLIKPGKSIGSLQVGAKTDSLQELGPPQKGDAGMCKSLSRWFYGDSTSGLRKELDVFSECDPDDEMQPHIKWIRTTDPVFQTKENIGVGSSLNEITRSFPSLTAFASYTALSDSAKMKMLHTANKGITFEMTTGEQDTCRAIIVYSPEETMPAMYFPFYENLKYLDEQ